MSNRRILALISLVVLFVVVVLVWYFVYAKPLISPSINGTKNPLPLAAPAKRAGFIFFNNDQQDSTTTTEVTQATPQALLEIWKKPATGARFVTQETLLEIATTTTQGTTTIAIKKTIHASTTVLMFVDRTTGYVYGHQVDSGKTYQISNTIVPGVYDAYIFDNGKHVVMRYFDNDHKSIVSQVSAIQYVSQDGSALPLVETTYLSGEVKSVAMNRKGTQLSYLVTNDAGSSVYTFTQKGPVLISSSPLGEWNLAYGGDVLYATTKPSAYVEGTTVSIPGYNYIVGGKTGLMSNPGEGGVTLSSMWSSSGLVTFVSSGSSLAVLPLKTIAEKCAWGDGGYLICAVPKLLPRKTEGLPDDWLQGRVSFDDSLVVIDRRTATVQDFFIFDDKISPFDVTSITLSDKNDLLSFIKKQTGSLWLLNTRFIPKDSTQ